MATEQTVSDIIFHARSFAQQKANNAAVRANKAIEIIAQLQLQAPDVDYLRDPGYRRIGDLPDIREPYQFELEDSEIRDIELKDPKLRNVNLRLTGAPKVTHKVGGHTKPTIPERFFGEVPDIDTNVTVPPVPNETLPDRSELFPITIPEAPVINLPDRHIVRPEFQGEIPEDAAEQYLCIFRRLCGDFEAKIDDKLCAELKKLFPNAEIHNEKLDTYLCDFMDGKKTAFTDAIEEQIYIRVQNRLDGQEDRQREEVLELARETSNPIMPLRVRAGLLRVNEAVAMQLTEHASGVAEQRAQREVEQLRVVLDHIMSLRQLYLTTRNNEFQQELAVMELALQASAEYVDILFKGLEAAIAIFSAELDGFRAEIEELTSLREFALAELQIWQGRLEGERLKTEINKSLVEQDMLAIRYIEAVYGIYESQIRALLAEIQLRKTPLEIYQAQVEAYNAYIQGVRGEVDIYRALIDGDIATIQGQVAEVEAWVAVKRLEGLELDFEKFKLEQTELYNRAQLQQFEAEVAREKHLIDIERLRFELVQSGVGIDITKYQTIGNIKLEEYKFNNTYRLQRVELNAKYLNLYENLVQQYNAIRLQQVEGVAAIHQQVASVYGNVGAAALNGITSLASTNVNVQQEQ